jgi:hypothetical protein
MNAKSIGRLRLVAAVAALFVLAANLSLAGPDPKQVKPAEAKKPEAKPAAKPAAKKDPVFTSAEQAARDCPDFNVQGEYEGTAGGAKIGIQVIALGDGNYQAVVCPGGLPGAGWDGKNKILLAGATKDGKVSFEPVKGARKYLAGPPADFSATSKFPPEGQKDWTGEIAGGKFTGKTDDGKDVAAKRVLRESPTLGAKAPEGAAVLFDGTNTTAWEGGRLDPNTKLLNTDGKDIKTKGKYTNYTMHVEFMLPFRPFARGQGRGNSGFYQVDLYEVQILDSFGLDGKNNECGGVYTKAEPKVNMCLPPLQWQTYDVDFASAVMDGTTVKSPATMTLKHNGVVIHENLRINGKTGGSRGDAEGTPGPMKLQGHGNPLQFRNIWIVEKK